VNRRAIEALIYAGAFDDILGNRKQLIADLDPILGWSADRAKAKAIGQASLFDLLPGNDSSGSQEFADVPHAIPTEDFPPQEKLKLEKELLGFYVSDHPLKRVQKQAKLLAPINLSDVGDYSGEVTVSVIGLVMAIKNVTTKKGDRMAILQIEDLSGSSEGVVFPKTYERIGSHLAVDQRLMIWAKIDHRDEQTQLIINDVEPIESVQLVRVELPAQQAGDIEFCYRLQTILNQQKGEQQEESRIPVIASIRQGHRHRLVRLGAQFQVKQAQTAVAALRAAGFRADAEVLLS
jgi:DNA polymerase-3 subunit alpha